MSLCVIVYGSSVQCLIRTKLLPYCTRGLNTSPTASHNTTQGGVSGSALACGAWKLFERPEFESRVKRASHIKKSQTAMSTTERYFTLSVVSLEVECTRRQRKGNSKKHSDSCRPACLKMERNVCPTTTTS